MIWRVGLGRSSHVPLVALLLCLLAALSWGVGNVVAPRPGGGLLLLAGVLVALRVRRPRHAPAVSERVLERVE